MINGRDALSNIQSALAGVRRDEDQLVSILNQATEDAARLRLREADAYRALARLRLDSLARDELSGVLSNSERRAATLLEQRKTALARAAQRRAAVEAALATALAERKARAEAVEDAAAAADTLRETTEARLKTDAGWLPLARAVTHAREIVDGAREKAERSEAQQAEKKRPYEADSLFMYLWGRGYGTAAYKAGNIARFFDGRIARLIAYEAARPNYFMLNEIPLRLREHAERLGAEVEAHAQALAAYERRALEADGVKRLEDALGEAEAALHAAERTVAEKQTELAGLDADEHGARADGADPHFKQALEILFDALSREDVRQLNAAAIQTPTPEDDAVVRSLQDIKAAIARADSQIEQARKAALQITAKRAELQRSENNFRRSGYDDPFGGFVNDKVIGEVLGGIVGGVLSSIDLEKTMRDGFQRREPKSRGSFGGGIRMPNGDPWPRGGRMGGGWSDGGGASGGGFKTGGSF